MLVYAITMTYGIEWNSKPSKGEEVGKKNDNDTIDNVSDYGIELLDLPAEILVIILNKLGYEELRSMEASCSYLRCQYQYVMHLPLNQVHGAFAIKFCNLLS